MKPKPVKMISVERRLRAVEVVLAYLLAANPDDKVDSMLREIDVVFRLSALRAQGGAERQADISESLSVLMGWVGDAESQPKAGSVSELAELFPGPRIVPVKLKRVVTVDGTPKIEWRDATISIEALSVRELGRTVQALKPILRDNNVPANIMALAAEYPEEIIAAAAVAIDWAPEEVALIDGASFFAVALAVFECNRDFFVRRLGPLVSEMLTMTATTIGAGSTQLGTYKNADTSPPSAITSPGSALQ